MKKNASGKSVLAFPYKSFTATCGKAIDLWETGPSTVKSFSAYYETLWEKYKEEIIEGARHVKDKGKMDVGYFALLPIKVIARLDSRSEYLQNYVRFFLRQSDEKPKDPLVDMYVVDDFERILLEDISCLKGTFWLMADGKLKPYEGCYDNEETFIGELEFAFEQYMGQYELMGDDAVWNLTFKLKKLWRNLVWDMLDIVFHRVDDDGPFDATFSMFRETFQELPPALYKLECRYYQEFSKKTGVSVYKPSEKKKR